MENHFNGIQEKWALMFLKIDSIHKFTQEAEMNRKRCQQGLQNRLSAWKQAFYELFLDQRKHHLQMCSLHTADTEKWKEDTLKQYQLFYQILRSSFNRISQETAVLKVNLKEREENLKNCQRLLKQKKNDIQILKQEKARLQNQDLRKLLYQKQILEPAIRQKVLHDQLWKNILLEKDQEKKREAINKRLIPFQTRLGIETKPLEIKQETKSKPTKRMGLTLTIIKAKRQK